jgi:hypothetical protein
MAHGQDTPENEAPPSQPSTTIALTAVGGDRISAGDTYRAIADGAGVEVTFGAYFTDIPYLGPDLLDLPFEEALRRLGTAAGKFAILQSDGSIMVADDSPQSRRSYEQIEVRVMPLRYRKPAVIERALRGTMDTRRLVVDEVNGTILMRDTPARICVAEQIVALLDQPPAEIDVSIRVAELPSSSVPMCGGTPCARVAFDALPEPAFEHWSSTLVVVGSATATQETEVDLANGYRLGSALKIGARHHPELEVVEMDISVIARVLQDSTEGPQSRSTETESSIRLSTGEAQVIRVAHPDAAVTVLVLLQPEVRRAAPWKDMEALTIPVGTEYRIESPCASEATIP